MTEIMDHPDTEVSAERVDQVLQARVNELTNELTEAREERNVARNEVDRLNGVVRERNTTIAQVREQHMADVERIGEALLGEASSRDWCEDYDTFVESLNERLNVDLPVRVQTFEVEVSGYVRTPFTYTVSVEARNDDDARQQAESTFDNNVGTSEVTLDEYSQEFEDDMEFEVQ